MKKLSLTLAALLVAGGLVACDDKSKSGTTPGFGKDVPAEAQVPAPAVVPVAPAVVPVAPEAAK